MNRKIQYIDVGDIPSNKIEEYIDLAIKNMKSGKPLPTIDNLPQKTKWQKTKSWIKDFITYGDFTTLGFVIILLI